MLEKSNKRNEDDKEARSRVGMDMNFTSDGDRIALMMMIIAREMANMMAMAMITANLIVILRVFF